MDLEPDWVHLSEDTNGIAMNSYFAEHPEMIIGKMEMVSYPYGMESTCQPDTTRPFAEQLSEAISRIDGEIEEAELDELESETADQTIPADPNVKNYSFCVVDGSVYYRENSVMKPVDMKDTMLERIKGMVDIRDCTQELIHVQLEEYPDTVIQEKQAELNSLYDIFSKNTVLSIRRPIRGRSIRTAAIVFYAPLKGRTRKGNSSARRICSQSARSRKRRLSQALTRQPKPLPCRCRRKRK